MNSNAVFHWSGGKDSALALRHISQARSHSIKYLLTSVNPEYQRVSMHGVRVELLKRQAAAVGIPLRILEVPPAPTMEVYNAAMRAMLGRFVREDGIGCSIFGDIFLEDLRDYRLGELAKVPMTGVFPIWQRPTQELMAEFIAAGFKAVTVCVNDRVLDESFVGREIDAAFVADLPAGVDPCGENGEFHTFVYDGPIFREPVPVQVGEKVHRHYQPAAADTDGVDGCDRTEVDNGFWYCDLLPME
ncbi:MAG: adenine nucleotide alpha hydrolase [Candidatus Omnitrophica bacterium]|nr:adenine nucleotide alpha hydrolase [Candidatus Omnitrophota bacterium]